MAEIAEVLNDIKTMSEDMGTQIKGIQDAQTKNDEKLVSIEVNAVEAAKKSVADSLAELQELKGKVSNFDKTLEGLQAMIARKSGNAGNDSIYDRDMENECKESMINYMRKGNGATFNEISNEAKEYMCKSIAYGNLIAQSDAIKADELKSLVAGITVDGGFFIRPELMNQMITRVFETSPIRSIANVVTSSSDSLEWIVDDDEFTSGGWVGETDPRDETGTGKIGKLTIPISELYAQPLVTQKMLDDTGFDVEAWASRKISDKFARTENTAFVIGDGSEKPRGFLDYDAWASAGVYERGKLERLNSGAAGALTGDGLIKLQNALLEAYQNGALFAMQRNTFTGIMTLKDSQGQYLLNPNVLKSGDSKILLGKDVIFMDDMQALASDSLSVAYGNFMQSYTIADRLGIRLIRDNVTRKPYIKLYTTKRVGGGVTNFQGLKILKTAV